MSFFIILTLAVSCSAYSVDNIRFSLLCSGMCLCMTNMHGVCRWRIWLELVGLRLVDLRNSGAQSSYSYSATGCKQCCKKGPVARILGAISHQVVQRHVLRAVGSLSKMLYICCWFWWWTSFKNRSGYAELRDAFTILADPRLSATVRTHWSSIPRFVRIFFTKHSAALRNFPQHSAARTQDSGGFAFCCGVLRSVACPRVSGPLRIATHHSQHERAVAAEMEPGLRITGHRVTGSAILAGSGHGTVCQIDVWTGFEF